MRDDTLYITGTGSYFPPSVPVASAVDDGLYEATAWESSRLVAIACAEPHDTAPTLAREAGERALKNSGGDPAQVDLLLHAVASWNGRDGWNCGAYLQNELLEGAGLAFELRQLSNGAAGGLELAASYLLARPGRSAALVTTADVFAPPTWDRWHADPGLVFGDGASALVLGRDEGVARVRSIATYTDSGLERMQRGDAPLLRDPTEAERPVRLADRMAEFLAGPEAAGTGARLADGVRRATGSALAEAGLTLDDVDHVVTPNFGHALLERQCLAPLGLPIECTTWPDFGAHVGHTGAADQFGGLDHLIQSGTARPGDTVLVLGVGGGFVWTSLLVTIL